MAYVWIGKEKGHLEWQKIRRHKLVLTKGCILQITRSNELNYFKRFRIYLTSINASSVGFYLLKLAMRNDPDLNSKPKRIHKVTKKPTKIMGQLAGFIFALVDGTYDSEAPDLKVGYDLVPGLSKMPTPWVLTPKPNGSTDLDFDFHEEVFAQAIDLRELA